ncbi:unnamed protein product [Rhizoctonia solani]|uniref:Uncharacterized protein n=1 Tax=Rhizoctonia solani TaxID=456999 RepID=A0A8H2WHW1_9AGAM|nr:unnamed protein product [Rhizoctonia solani]
MSAGTMRGQWLHGSGYSTLAPPHQASSPRPRSEDFSLDAELGYVLAIGSGEDTIRCRPDLPPAEPPPPRLRHANQTIIESSRENLSQMTLSPPIEIPSPTLPEFVPAPAIEPAALNTNVTKQPGNVVRLRQSPVPPISIPPPAVPVDLESFNSAEKTPATILDSDPEDDLVPTTFPFTPVDDRSDVTSSTNNTPHSGDRSRVPPSVPPPLLSPSPRPETSSRTEYPFLKPLPPLVNRIQPSDEGDTGRSGKGVGPFITNAALIGVPNGLESVSEGPSGGQSIELLSKDAPNGTGSEAPDPVALDLDLSFESSRSSALGLAAEQSDSALGTNVFDRGSSRFDSDPSATHTDKHDYLLSTLRTLNFGGHSAAPSGQDTDPTDMSGATSRINPIPGKNRLGEQVFQSVQPATPPVNDPNQGSQYLSTIEDDLAKLLSPYRFSPPRDRAIPEPGQLRTPASAHVSLPSASLTPQPSPLHRAGTRLPLPVSTPSPSALSARVNDLLSAKSSVSIQRPGPIERNAVSLNGSPMLSFGKLSSSGSWGADQAYHREAVATPSNPARLPPRRSPSVGGVVTRKRSASFDSSGSPKIARDASDPFALHLTGPKRTDWLGPRTAKAFAAAGLIEKDRDRTGLGAVLRSDTPTQRGGALNSWRTHGERYGGFGSGAGSVRSHSRLGSEIISPSYRTRSLVGGDSSPSYRRSSLDHTAPPSPVSTHRTLVSSVTSSSQSQSALQTMRERHELETEALLLALAGSKRTERDLRAENDELMAYIVQLERRIAVLEVEKEQVERSQSRARDHRWNTPSPLDVEALDKRRQEILAGRASARGWSGSNASTISGGRSPLYGRTSIPAGLTRSPSAASVRKSIGPEFDRISPSKPWDTATSRTSPRNQSTLSTVSTPIRSTVNHSVADISTPTRDSFDDWNDPSFIQPLESSPKISARSRLSSSSLVSLLPQVPGNMSMLVHERPGGEFSEDGISFRSTSPSSITLVHRQSNTPKPTPANISPVTADFSFNSIPGSPRSLRLGPEEEMHLADLISLQGLEIADVIGDIDA